MTARVYDLQVARDAKILREAEEVRGIVPYPTVQSHAQRCLCRECRLARAKKKLGEDEKDCDAPQP